MDDLKRKYTIEELYEAMAVVNILKRMASEDEFFTRKDLCMILGIKPKTEEG